MSRRNVITFLTAPARSGKTFRMVVRICDELLPHGDGVIYVNLPLYPELIADYCEEKHGMEREKVLARLHIIPREVEHAWKEAGQPIYDMEKGRKTGMHPFEGPWSYFADKDLSGSTIIIDEVHNFCGSGSPKAISRQWQNWLGELGHNQAVFICISQAPEKVHPCIKQEAQASYVIKNTGLDRDPYFKIELYDWLELWAGLFNRPYNVFVFEQEIQKSEGRRVRGQRKLTRMGPPYFDLYDSFNKPIASEQTSNIKAFEHEYEKHLSKGPIRGRLSLIRWFLFKNIQPLASRGFVAVLLVGLFAFMMTGGAGKVMSHISSAIISKSGGKQSPPAETQKSQPAPPKKEIVDKKTLDTATKEEVDKIAMVQQLYEEELRKALTEKETLAVDAEKAKQELEKLTEEIERQTALVLITPDTIVFQGGYIYEVGEEIRRGKYKGRTVSSIDFKSREALLDDDSILSLVP